MREQAKHTPLLSRPDVRARLTRLLNTGTPAGDDARRAVTELIDSDVYLRTCVFDLLAVAKALVEWEPRKGGECVFCRQIWSDHAPDCLITAARAEIAKAEGVTRCQRLTLKYN
jgi:phage baseplate assembly protein W